MKRFLLFVSLAITLFACKKEEVPGLATEAERVIPNREIVKDVFADQYGNRSYNIYPSWVLQVNGVRAYYLSKSQNNKATKSGGVGKLLNNNLTFEIEAGDEDAVYTIKTLESEINHESEYFLVIEKSEGKTTTQYWSVPVDWKYDALLKNENSTSVQMRWAVYEGDTLLQTYSQQFYIRSLHEISVNVVLDKEEYDYYSKHGIDSLYFRQYYEAVPSKTDPKKTEMKPTDNYLAAMPIFTLGFIDENSPALMAMRREILEDTQLATYFFGEDSPIFGGLEATTTRLENELKVFTYWLLKNKVTYSLISYDPLQYYQTTDQIIKSRQAYCAEIACTVASYLASLGYDVSFDIVPQHAVNRVFFNGAYKPIDFTELISNTQVFWGSLLNKYPNPNIREILIKGDDSDFITTYYHVMLESNKSDESTYKKGRKDITMWGYYGTVKIKEARRFLPSFSCADYHTKARHYDESEPGVYRIK